MHTHESIWHDDEAASRLAPKVDDGRFLFATIMPLAGLTRHGLFLVARILGPVIRAETARFVLADPAAGEARTEYARLPTRATVALGDKLLGQYGLPPAGGDVIASKDAAIRCRRATPFGNRNSPASVCHQKAEKRRFLDNIHQWEGSIVKITTLIIVLLGLATASGAAMIVSVKKEPVLLACGGANC